MATEKVVLWVVYKTSMDGKLGGGMNVVCEQREWDAIELAQPGRHTLVRAGKPANPKRTSWRAGPRATA
jgi:hypothetical protein